MSAYMYNINLINLRNKDVGRLASRYEDITVRKIA